MKNKIKQVFSVLILTLIMFISFSPTVFAETIYSTKTVDSTATTSTSEDEDYSFADTGLPSPTMDEANAWVDRKGSQLITVFQTFGSKVCIAGFIIMAMVAIFGKTGNGIYGMVISAVAYVCILYAPELLHLIRNFMLS